MKAKDLEFVIPYNTHINFKIFNKDGSLKIMQPDTSWKWCYNQMLRFDCDITNISPCMCYVDCINDYKGGLCIYGTSNKD